MDLTNPIFHDEDKARTHFESIRWPNGRICPHCETSGNSSLMKGEAHRAGLYTCRTCRRSFTATIGTICESSHVPLHKWLLAIHLMGASKKGVSASQLHRTLGLGSYRTAWFMAHRIREAMKRKADEPPLGGAGGAVEVDETFIGYLRDKPKARGGHAHKMKILSLVDRASGEVRSMVVRNLSLAVVGPVLERNISQNAKLMTDEFPLYKAIAWNFADHGTVHHGNSQWVKGDAYTNTVEGFFSIFKRGMRGVYQHCSERHLQRYVAEFDFRYSNRKDRGVDDAMRAERILRGIVGRRLKYGQLVPQALAAR